MFKSIKAKHIKCFISFYALSLVLNFIFRYVLMNYLPALHDHDGLIKGDNVFIHNLALEMLSDIKTQGWSAFRVFPNNNLAGTINVGIATTVYYFFGINPAFIIPINVFFHIISAAVLYKLSLNFFNRRTSASIISIFFTVSPTSFLWTSQLLKDNYAILAWLLFFYCALLFKKNNTSLVTNIVLMSLSMGIFYVTRPLYIILIILILLVLLLYQFLKKNFEGIKNVSALLMIASFATFSFYYFDPVANAKPDYYNTVERRDLSKYSWRGFTADTPYATPFVQLQSMRINQIFFTGTESHSLIDRDFIPTTEFDFLTYFPRAFQIALFYPNPISLFKLPSIQGKILGFEFLLYYLFFFLFLLFIKKNYSHENFIPVLIVILVPSIFLAYISPVMGTYHRIRFPFYILTWSFLIDNFITNLASKWRSSK